MSNLPFGPDFKFSSCLHLHVIPGYLSGPDVSQLHVMNFQCMGSKWALWAVTSLWLTFFTNPPVPHNMCVHVAIQNIHVWCFEVTDFTSVKHTLNATAHVGFKCTFTKEWGLTVITCVELCFMFSCMCHSWFNL